MRMLIGTTILLAALPILAACAGSPSNSLGIAPQINQSQLRRHPSLYTQKLLVASGGNSSILVFGLPSAGGNVAPTQDIHGSDTKLNDPLSVTVGPAGYIFADNRNGQSVYKYAPSASGDAAPISHLDQNYIAVGLVTDSSGDIWVGGFGLSTLPPIFEYASGAHGTATPINTIVGSHTGLSNNIGLTFDGAGKLYVACGAMGSSYGDGAIQVFSSTASGNASPINTISGVKTKLAIPTQVTIDNSTYGAGRILVSDSVGNVLVFSASASGNATPIADITSVTHPAGVATDSSGNIYVSVPNENSIRVFAPGATGNASPTIVIHGTNSNISSPGQLFITQE